MPDRAPQSPPWPFTLPSSSDKSSSFQHLLGKARDAAIGGHDAWSVQSTGEKVAVALVLNRADWLAEMRYTLAEAIDRAGTEWIMFLPQVERVLRDELEERERKADE